MFFKVGTRVEITDTSYGPMYGVPVFVINWDDTRGTYSVIDPATEIIAYVPCYSVSELIEPPTFKVGDLVTISVTSELPRGLLRHSGAPLLVLKVADYLKVVHIRKETVLYLREKEVVPYEPSEALSQQRKALKTINKELADCLKLVEEQIDSPTIRRHNEILSKTEQLRVLGFLDEVR